MVRPSELRSLLDATQRKIEALKPFPGAGSRPLREIVGESYVQQLGNLSDAEAVQYLKTVDDAKLGQAYLILSKQLSNSVLIEVCLDYLARPTFTPRLIGMQIGVLLYGTYHRRASQMLATIIQDAQEQVGIRNLAYSSLKQINADNTMMEDVRQWIQSEPSIQASSLVEINWDFVNSFLSVGA
jgi:hypothetical protein